MPRRRAFTIIELLITIGIIVLLASLIIVALGGVRSAAARAKSSAALRQMLVAYDAYGVDHEKRLMPGYVSGDRLQSLGIRSLLNGERGFIDDTVQSGGGSSDASSYVFRLLPYMGDQWKTFLDDYNSAALESRFDDELRGYVYDDGSGPFGPVYGPATESAVPNGRGLGLARLPAYGLNSIYLGGDDVHGGGATAFNPWDNPANTIAATRVSEVRRPSDITVFVPTAWWSTYSNPAGSPVASTPVTGITYGYCEARPPSIALPNGTQIDYWTYTAGNTVDVLGNFGSGGGIPFARESKAKGDVPIAHLDGSVTQAQVASLAVERKRWDPFYTGP